MSKENRSSASRSRRRRINAVSFIGGYSHRHHTEEAAVGYRSLCLRGFVVQGSLDHKNPVLEDVYRIIDSIGWSYTVMHVHPLCPRVVREFISNKPFNDEGALIRGYVFRFTPSLINQLMMILSVEHSFKWRNVDLSQAITHLTGGQCSGWTGFNLNALNPFKALYRVCELNWLPGPDFDAMLKNRLHLLYDVANRHKIDFGHLLLMLQKEIPLLPGDEEPIGRGLPIFGLTDVTISFSWNSVLSVLENCPVQFLEDRFRFYGYEEFESACDLKGDLYDYIGHIKLVNEQALGDSLVLDEVEIASSRRILVHVQTHDARKHSKCYPGDYCKPETIWRLDSNSEVSNRINADIVTKAETVTIGELFTYIKQEGANVAWFECTATIDDVGHGSAWYYIACDGCKTKATKGPTTLMCKKCGKAEVAGVAE
ncbi:hypothetical protein F2Q69_00060561 [Brassica cretica]|uniref:Replication factor A C-terminal domain-containing protein n=1 Tax=Brassica cretica TaxID=69181 RepID=A0A8S9RPT2_BRACR|nr:hypothetical protein F2Q69_00060561 [Brassica cretica]